MEINYYDESTIRQLADNPPMDPETLEMAYRVRKRQYLREDAHSQLLTYCWQRKEDREADDTDLEALMQTYGFTGGLTELEDDLVEKFCRCKDCNIDDNDMWQEIIQDYLNLLAEKKKEEARQIAKDGHPQYAIVVEDEKLAPACALAAQLAPIFFVSEADVDNYLQKNGVAPGTRQGFKVLCSNGVCWRCKAPLFPSLLAEEGYKYQCLVCDEDFYAFEQK